MEEAEKAQREAKIRAEKAESRTRELEAQLQSAKTQADKCLEGRAGHWNAKKAELEKQCAEIRAISEQRRLDLYVVEAKLMQAEGANNAVITDLQKRLATAQFDVSMTQEKVQVIIRRHRLNTLKLVYESLEKGWKTWSAAELWLLRTERENQKAQGSGFFQMSEEAIATVQ